MNFLNLYYIDHPTDHHHHPWVCHDDHHFQQWGIRVVSVTTMKAIGISTTPSHRVVTVPLFITGGCLAQIAISVFLASAIVFAFWLKISL